ncbi:MAG: DUF2799 domain-containing protein [Gammaproteobacteria bacterium]|nr:DUF2799 domain-containing protein [Gammaproteobacteria bacterium]
MQGYILTSSIACPPTQQTPHKKGLAAAISLASLALLLQGCATLSENECETADWWLIGQEDGSKGLSLAHIEEHRESCAEHGVTPDRDAYAKGHRSGLAVYCTRFTGYKVGRSGRPYHGICDGPLAEAFDPGLRRGRMVHALETKAWDIKQKRESLGEKIGRLEHERKTLQEKLAADESIPQDLESMAEKVVELGQELEVLKQEYEDSAQTQADAVARFDEAIEQARDDGYADDGELLGGTRRIIRSLKDELD